MPHSTNISHEKTLDRIDTSMRRIGYTPNLIKRNYEFADYSSDTTLKKIPLAGFAQEPNDYRNACIGVISANGKKGEVNVIDYHFLGAPLVFEIYTDTLKIWKIEKEQPRFLEQFTVDNIERAFKTNKENWKPQLILEAKRRIRQLDFVDAGYMEFLEGTLHQKLQDVLEDSIKEISGTFNKSDSNYLKNLYRLIFYFIAAKVFKDRKYNPCIWESNDPNTLLDLIYEHYGDDVRSIDYTLEQKNKTWKKIAPLHFQNLSIEDLTYIYENTFIDKDRRKLLGIHSTPGYIAEYVINSLPFNDIPMQERVILEPFSGGASFLIAGLRKLRDLLPPDMDPTERSSYFRNNLIGIEIEEFAVEISKLCLMLADYPYKDNWNIIPGDVFGGNLLTDNLNIANIVVANPPFEKFDEQYRSENLNRLNEVWKPEQFFSELLKVPPKYLGLILPLRFLYGRAFKKYHNKLLSLYSYVEVGRLPERIFSNQQFETSILIAHNLNGNNKSVSFSSYSINAYEKYNAISSLNNAKRNTKVVLRSNITKLDSLFYVPKLDLVWDCLQNNSRLGDSNISEMHKGVCLKSDKKLSKYHKKKIHLFSNTYKEGFKKGYTGTKEMYTYYRFNQFYLEDKISYISCKPEDNENQNWKFNWHLPKVVFNSARREGIWRIRAFYDLEGHVFTKNYFAIWEKEEYSLFETLAILNSPLTNAYVYDFDIDKHNRISTIENLPMPSLDALRNEKVNELAQNLNNLIDKYKSELVDDKAKNIIKKAVLQLDAAVLKAYDLPPRLERQLLDTFQGHKRPLPFDIKFEWYYPEGMDAAIPLHILLSQEFKESSADKVKKRLKAIDDPEVTAMLKWLNEED